MGNEESMKNRHYSINSNTLGEHPELHITNIMVMVLIYMLTKYVNTGKVNM